MIEKNFILGLDQDAIQRYNKRLDKLGISPQTLGWGAREEQLQRFQVIIEQCSLEGKTVLDIGCGFADFYQFLLDKRIHVNYIGVDINPHFIKHCTEKFPDQRFICQNIILDDGCELDADVVISLGTLNFKLKDNRNYQYSKYFIQKAFAIAKEKLVVDFLSEYLTDSYPKEDFVFYHSPQVMFDFAMQLSNNAMLVHNYPPIPQKEFMIIMEK